MSEEKLKDGVYRIEGVEMEEAIHNGKTAIISFTSPCKKYDKIEIYFDEDEEPRVLRTIWNEDVHLFCCEYHITDRRFDEL